MMHSSIRISIAVLLFLFLSGRSIAAREVIGYYADWQFFDRENLAQPSNIDFSKWSIINYAFFWPDEQGNIYQTDEWAHTNVLFGSYDWNNGAGGGEQRCWVPQKSPMGSERTADCAYFMVDEGLIRRAHEAGCKVLPSIGGWTLSSTFPALAAEASSRTRFVGQCMKLIRDYGFDGIDLDWEYPGFADHNGTPSDKNNFTALLSELRDSIELYHPGKLITAALACGPERIDAGYDVPAISGLLDQLNLMTYDFHGSWDTYTGHNSPLYHYSAGDPDPVHNCNGCVELWVERGAPRSKINIGAGFYGVSFAGATSLGGTHSGYDEITWDEDDGKPMYYAIADRLSTMRVEYDTVAEAAYAFLPDGGMVSYENERSLAAKAAYIVEQQLNGIIVWDMAGGLMADKTQPLVDVINEHLHDETKAIRTVDRQKATDGFIGHFTVIDVRGRTIHRGTNRQQLRAFDASPGVYFIRFEKSPAVKTRLLKRAP